MASPRRLRVLTYLVLAAIVTLLFFNSRARDSLDPAARNFYSKTVDALDRDHVAGVGGSGGRAGQRNMASHDADADDDIDEDDALLSRQMAERLRQAEQKAKDIAKAKGPNKPEAPEQVIGVGSSASGQEKPAQKAEDGTETKESEEDHEVEEVLNVILKKSPVIIFSKSYCPFSKTAKGILLEKYVIEPAPFVVELDLHPLGPKIQARLGEMTGRRTVPNVMVYGQSIGGGDDISALDRERALADKITSLGGTRIGVSLRFEQSAQKAP